MVDLRPRFTVDMIMGILWLRVDMIMGTVWLFL